MTAIGTFATCRAGLMMSVVRGRPEVSGRSQRTSASISFCGSKAGFSPINVLVLADTMLLPDHEGAHEAARSSWCYWRSSSVAARGVGAAAQERTSHWIPGDGFD